MKFHSLPGPEEAKVHTHFSFTPAEAKLVDRLVAGKSLRQAAHELKITYETARTTLKSIFHKTGTHRQAELIIKLLGKVAIISFVLFLATCSGSFAGGDWPDSPDKAFLESLQRPDNDQNPQRRQDPKSLSCCGAADTVKTRYRVESTGGAYPDDVWYAWLNDRWVRIPPEKIVKDYSPDGQPFLFLLAGTIQCFVRPKGGG